MSADSVAQDQIRSFVERILRLKEEAKDINRDIREVYAEAKSNGFDKTVLGKVVSYVEKRASGAADLAEAEALFDLYLSAYDGVGTRVATHTHEKKAKRTLAEMRGVFAGQARARVVLVEDIPEHDAETGEVIEPEAAMLPQTVPSEIGAGYASAEQASVESSATIPEPLGAHPTDPLGSGAAAREDADTAAPEPSNVTAFRTHNPETHFLNSKGLQRLHGCLNGENCAGSRSKLCFTCSTQHDGPAYQDGAA